VTYGNAITGRALTKFEAKRAGVLALYVAT
jgi:hypothetical protein